MTALLIVGHGTRDEAGDEDFRLFVAGVRDRAASSSTSSGTSKGRPAASGSAVEGGFIELSTPPVGEAVARLVGAGHRRVAAVPLVLVAAGHAKGDIPGSLNRERLQHPGLSFA